MFVYLCEVFFGLTEGCICECSEDVQADFSFSVNVVSVVPERQTSVVGHSKCGGVFV